VTESFEDQYLDVLQNIESALVHAYRENPYMNDYEADRAVDALIRTYQAEMNGRERPTLKLNPSALSAYTDIKWMTDFRLGREKMKTMKHMGDLQLDRTLSLPEIIACLKRVLRSIRMWNKKGGRRGYFNFIDQFFP
jgi:hypothetical protein